MENEIIVKTNNTKVENIFNEDGRVTSVELVKLINKFRSMESEANEEKVFKELEHKDFMKKIRKELEVLKNLGLGNEGNISPVKYTDKKGEIRPCYLLNRDGTLQMLNSESTYVRAMTIEYINKLEKQLKEMNKDSYLIADPIERAKRWIEEQEEKKRIEAERDRLIHVGLKYTSTEIAKELNMRSARELNMKLANKKIQYKQGNVWVLYSQYADKGYTSIKEEVLDNGKIVYHRKWTPEGRDFILSIFV